ncbi:ABC transporter ATP-binding protein [Sinirhodobacter populi]|uniref:ABC transporter ATP-binding protein n=1 Tax=Paenirhodobacter populi TaxID=2306993 RepID=A0A443IS02_9RHOB|nr:ABC transporter ATP-binding protein [Sinirhodobacter populi]RWR10354.1 ABC transporter ATP-binding protein [Sinirhodobacter populi]RWR20536.1 ABC transporter ATP-binding protein [Sinirhodobacter populi]RWR26203.1 ABC transporter ATP-binding protein [Sinirhodobacter populi]
MGIRVRDLALRFHRHVIFENLSFDIEPGQFVALLGSSGVGKSSLLKIIAGLQSPSAGSVTATDGGPVPGRIAYMGQQDLLYPWLTLRQNVTLGARLRGEKPDLDWADHLIERVGLTKRRDALPMMLSGGMRQRAAIARTLYERKQIVLMDEPFSALDAITRASVQDLAAELLADATALLITHDPMEACRLGKVLLVLSGGPAKLDAPMVIPGAIPRHQDEPHVVAAQAALLRRFQELQS